LSPVATGPEPLSATPPRDPLGDEGAHASYDLDPSERPPAPSRPSTRQRAADLSQLIKPGITRMVVITAAIGYIVALDTEPGGIVWSGRDWWLLPVTLLGVALACAGASALNQVWERSTDARMPRTSGRPVAAGRMTPAFGAGVGLVLAAAGPVVLLVSGAWLAALVSVLTVGLYLLVYTPMKRLTPWSVWFGAIPGAAPPLIGYAAASGTLDRSAWAIFGIMCVWQVPHFLAIAQMYREQYASAGLRMLPEPDPGLKWLRTLMAVSGLGLLLAGLGPWLVGSVGAAYGAVAAVMGLGFAGLCGLMAWRPGRAQARRVFFASLVYLPVVLGALVVGRVWR
jgi:protoheme IX farnesyltransferase